MRRKMKSGIERERKFLVRELPGGLRRRRHDPIEQGYLTTASPHGPELRLRREGRRMLLTAKSGAGAARAEVEVPLAARAFAALWPLTAGRRLRKVRYTIPHVGVSIQLDLYRGRLRGLAVAEIEFPSAAAMRRFRPPPWLGREVTGRAAYSNSDLAAARRAPRRT